MDGKLQIGSPAILPCSVLGQTVGAELAPTTDAILIGAEMQTAPLPCAMVSAAVTLADGTILSTRGDYC